MVHTYSLNGYNIALDINSGAVHILDKLAFEMLKALTPELKKECPDELISSFCKDYTKEEINSVYNELFKLFEEGLLFSEDEYESLKNLKQDKTPIKALCLHVSHDCNLRCKYCFAHTGDFGTGRSIMDEQTAKNAIDFVIEKSLNRKNIEIDFFGGEPLMAFDTVKKTVEYAKEIGEKNGKNFRFTITTNGVLLNDEITDYINENMSNIVLSHDGRKKINDKVRTFTDGSGCYDEIMPAFKKLVAKRGDKDYYIRATFTKNNLDFKEDVMHFAKEGFKNISIEPVVLDESSPLAIKKEHLERIFNEYESLAKEMTTNDSFSFFHFLIDLEQGPCVIKRLRGCGAGSEYVAITPEGDIYPCHQFVGVEKYKLGNLSDDNFNYDISNEFASINVYSKQECKECFAKFYCSGGCAAANYLQNGDIKKPYEISCELERKRVECAIMLKANDALKEKKQ